MGVIFNEEKAKAEFVSKYNSICEERDTAVETVLSTAKEKAEQSTAYAELLARQAEERDILVDAYANEEAENTRKSYAPIIAFAEEFLTTVEEPKVETLEV